MRCWCHRQEHILCRQPPLFPSSNEDDLFVAGILKKEVKDHPCVGDTEMPLISCIMPTQGRVSYVAQAVKFFQRQSYLLPQRIVAAAKF